MGFQIEFCQIALKKYNLSASSSRLISLKVTFSWCFKLKCLKQIQKCVSKDHWKFCFTCELWGFGFWNRGKLPVYIRENLLTYKKMKAGKVSAFCRNPAWIVAIIVNVCFIFIQNFLSTNDCLCHHHKNTFIIICPVIVLFTIAPALSYCTEKMSTGVDLRYCQSGKN